MYLWVWRRLPGGTAVRVLLSLLLFAGVVALLFFAVFPRLDEVLPFGDVTVDGRAADLQRVQGDVHADCLVSASEPCRRRGLLPA